MSKEQRYDKADLTVEMPPPPAAKYDADSRQFKPAESPVPIDDRDVRRWSKIDAITHDRSKSAFLGGERADAVGGDLSNIEAINKMTEEHAYHHQQYLREHCMTTQFRERVMQFLFRRYASWNVGENGSFMNRTSFRQCCRELELVGRSKKFVTGDIEVCFADGLLSVSNESGNIAGQRLGQSKKSPAKRRPLLNYRQFVMAVQGIAIKLYGMLQYQHLDPRYVAITFENVSEELVQSDNGQRNKRHPFDEIFMDILLPKALQFGFGMDDFAGPSSRTGGLATSPLSQANAAVGSPDGADIGLMLSIGSDSDGGIITGRKAVDAAAAGIQLSEEIRFARKILNLDKKALDGIFGAFALSDSRNSTGVLTESGMSFNEFSHMARECDLIPRYLSLSQLLVVFRQYRKIFAGDFDLDYSGVGAQVPAHMDFEGFCNALCSIALKYVRRGRLQLNKNMHYDGSDDGLISFEDPREKVMALLKTIANSRGIRQMALRPRRAATVRFRSRMSGFR